MSEQQRTQLLKEIATILERHPLSVLKRIVSSLELLEYHTAENPPPELAKQRRVEALGKGTNQERKAK